MKNNIILLLIVGFFAASTVSAQDVKMLNAAAKSFKAGEQNYNHAAYTEAASSLEIVTETIDVNNDSCKFLTMRFEANIMLIDIYFEKVNNLSYGCRCLNSFYTDFAKVKNSGILKVKDITKYLELEKQYEKYKVNCENFESIDKKRSDFNSVFEDAFDEDE